MHMWNVKVIGCFCVIAAPLWGNMSRADDVTDLYFQQSIERYFEYPQNARTFGMAGSSVPTSRDSSSVIGNPAGLAAMRGGEVSGSYGFSRLSGNEFPTDVGVEQRTNAGQGMIAFPIVPRLNDRSEYGNFGLAWSTESGDWHDDSFDTEMERTTVTAAYAVPISDTVNLGYSLGWFDDRFQSHAVFDYPMGNGLRHTLGAQWQQSRDTQVGAALLVGHGRHHALFGPGIKGDSDMLQVGADVGVEQRMERWLVAVRANYSHLSSDGEVVSSIPQNVVGGDENGNIFGLAAGLEYQIDRNITVRGGYRLAGLDSYRYNRVELNDLNGSAYYNAWTLGAGWSFPVHSDYVTEVDLDYGVEYRDVGDHDWQHVITASIPFSVCEPLRD